MQGPSGESQLVGLEDRMANGRLSTVRGGALGQLGAAEVRPEAADGAAQHQPDLVTGREQEGPLESLCQGLGLMSGQMAQ